MDLQLGDSVNQATVINLNQQVEMAQEVSSQDKVLHVHDNEGPLEGLTESQVQAEGAYTVGHDGGLVGSLQGGSCGGIGTTTTGGRNNAHLGTCIHQEAQVTGPVCNKNRRLGGRPEVLVADSNRPAHFPARSKGRCICWPCLQSAGGTSRGQRIDQGRRHGSGSGNRSVSDWGDR